VQQETGSKIPFEPISVHLSITSVIPFSPSYGNELVEHSSTPGAPQQGLLSLVKWNRLQPVCPTDLEVLLCPPPPFPHNEAAKKWQNPSDSVSKFEICLGFCLYAYPLFARKPCHQAELKCSSRQNHAGKMWLFARIGVRPVGLFVLWRFL